MVEEGTVPQNKQPSNRKIARPKPVYSWTVSDVQKWLKRHCSEYAKYHPNFQNHEITGKSLLRLTDESLERMGIDNNEDRDTVLRELLKLRLKTNMQDLKDLELSTNTIYENTNSK